MDGDMVDPPEPRDEQNDLPDDATPASSGAPSSGDEARGHADTGADDDTNTDTNTDNDTDNDTDNIGNTDDDDFDAIIGDIDYSDVDVPALLVEREQFKEMAQRVQADFDNYRKRAVAQSLAEADRASGRLAEALLPVLDAAEAAFVRHPDEVGPLLNQMLVELKRHGLEVLALEGKPFDPEVAEAVAHEPGEGGEPIVADVLRSGYTWKGKTLRPAMVKTRD
jgi:molecular chaperone GrpE